MAGRVISVAPGWWHQGGWSRVGAGGRGERMSPSLLVEEGSVAVGSVRTHRVEEAADAVERLERVHGVR